MKIAGYGYHSVWPNEAASNHRTKPRLEEGAATLNALSGLVDTSRQEPVAFKMVVTATGDCAYRRTDGIVVCPISALRP